MTGIVKDVNRSKWKTRAYHARRRAVLRKADVILGQALAESWSAKSGWSSRCVDVGRHLVWALLKSSRKRLPAVADGNELGRRWRSVEMLHVGGGRVGVDVKERKWRSTKQIRVVAQVSRWRRRALRVVIHEKKVFQIRWRLKSTMAKRRSMWLRGSREVEGRERGLCRNAEVLVNIK